MGFYSILYLSVDDLMVVLNEYRLFWVIDFITETADDLLKNYPNLLTERETLVCRKLSSKEFSKVMKSQQLPIPLLRWKIAQTLYETFKICRKLKIDDKEIVIENFNLNRIEQ
jgi:hypothetical protein